MNSFDVSQYSDVPFEKLHTNVVLPFSLYLLLPTAQKLVVFRKQGDVLEAEKHQLMKKSSHRFFVKNTEVPSMQAFIDQAPKEFVNMLEENLYRPNLASQGQTLAQELRLKSVENLANFLKVECDTSGPQAAQNLVKAVHEKIDAVVNATLKILGVGSNLIKQIETFLLSNQEEGLQPEWNHSTSTCALSVIIAAAVGKNDKKALTDIATAAYIHDIGLVSLGMSPPRPDTKWSEEEWAQYKTHPLCTLEIVEIVGMQISEVAKLMIYQHEERFDGSGFPQGHKGPQILGGAQIISLADALDQLICPTYPAALSPEEALQELWQSSARAGGPPLFHPQFLEQLLEGGFQAGVFSEK